MPSMIDASAVSGEKEQLMILCTVEGTHACPSVFLTIIYLFNETLVWFLRAKGSAGSSVVFK